uniref:Caspase activity and apoptosis inhibitor 1 n=1 Tax=Oryzias melastigma TaxID=30732 RepID=A0A3B3BGH0_ORYME
MRNAHTCMKTRRNTSFKSSGLVGTSVCWLLFCQGTVDLLPYKMLKKKSSNSEKKRKQACSEERHEGIKRRSFESHQEDSKDDLADPDLDRVGSDIEEGGLDLSLPFKPITAYISDKREMLEQCFRVLGEKKLQKMLPDELKECSLKEIQELCWEQLQPISEENLIQILAGEELMSGCENSEGSLETQQDNNVDSTSYHKETTKTEDPKQEVGCSGEESDVLSINADAYDSDIEAPKEEPSAKPASGKAAGSRKPPVNPGPKKDILSDIDKSVSEILSLSSPSNKDAPTDAPPPNSEVSGGAESGPPPCGDPTVCPPSAQQLELLELEMRARAIKALMKASDGKQRSLPTNT